MDGATLTLDQQQQWQFFYEIFDPSLPRLGPGDDASTLRALRTLLELKHEAGVASQAGAVRVLDIGCGNGAQTLQLARHVDGSIVALDNHRPFLDELERRACAEGLSNKIELRLKDMGDLGQEDGIFDLVWAEGSLFVVGMRNGLRTSVGRLVPGGLAAVSELAWLRSDRPADCQEYFDVLYPAMVDVTANVKLMSECGFEVVDHFVLPESAWWEPYYLPLEARLDVLREKYAADPDRLQIVDSVQAEIEMYREYSAFYGNVFFLLRRRE
jgi:SAM-dependent methyltransferase